MDTCVEILMLPNTERVYLFDTSLMHPSFKPVIIKQKINSQQITIAPDIFDIIAIDWCKKRNLNTNKYTLEQLLAQSTDACVDSYDISTESLEESEDDKVLIELVNRRLVQTEIDAKLTFNKLSDNEPYTTEPSKHYLNATNDKSKLRDKGQQLQSLFPILSNINNAEEHKEALAIIESLLDDYDKNLLLIDALSCAIARYEGEAANNN